MDDLLTTALARAQAAIDLGRADLAITEARRALAIEPDSAEAHRYRALALSRLERKEGGGGGRGDRPLPRKVSGP